MSPTYTLLVVPPTTQPLDESGTLPAHSVLGSLLAALPDGVCDVHVIRYPSRFRFDDPTDANIVLAVTNIADAARCATHPVVLVGHSQGAQFVRAVLEQRRGGQHTDLRLHAIGLIGDPWRPPDIDDVSQLHAHAPLRGWGVAGHKQVWTVEPDALVASHPVVWEIVMPDDLVANATGDSPARFVVDWRGFSVAAHSDLWAHRVTRALRDDRRLALRRNWLRPLSTWIRYRTAIEGIRDYGLYAQSRYATAQVPDLNCTYTEFLARLIKQHCP